MCLLRRACQLVLAVGFEICRVVSKMVAVFRTFVTFSSFGFAFTVDLVKSMHEKHGFAAHTQGA